jgi:3-oxoacyl-[acyl-carrier-protein] synthase-3
MKYPRATITAIHYCLPPQILTQDALARRFSEKQVSNIAKVSGIWERRVAPESVTSVDLGEQAVRGLLKAGKILLGDVDLLVFVTQTGDYQIPASACVLHGRLGLEKHCASFDIGLGCSAFPYALSVVNGLIATGVARKAVLVNADTLTKVIHPRDRGLVPLHGDGAVATLLEPSDGSEEGLLGFELGTDGLGHEHLKIPASGARKARNEETRKEIVDDSGSVRTEEHLYMNGPAVFQFSIQQVPNAIKRAFEKWKISIEDIDLLILHQANKMMLDLIYKKLAVPPAKQFFFMEKIGNMSGASTPMVLAEAWRSGRLTPGSLIVLASFGVGLSWGVALIRVPMKLADMTGVTVDYVVS